MMKTYLKRGQELEKYFLEGKRNANLFLDVIKRNKPQLANGAIILDYGCGHGRITRFLQNLFSPKKLVVADVWKGAVNFCSKEFDAIPFIITEENQMSKLPLKFDVILSFSVFSHLPPKDFENTLLELKKSLNDNGILLFTTKGEFDSKKFEAALENGFYFGHFGWKKPNETEGRLPVEKYSTMIVSRKFVEKTLNKVGLKLLEHLQDSNKLVQEMYVVEPIKKEVDS